MASDTALDIVIRYLRGLVLMPLRSEETMKRAGRLRDEIASLRAEAAAQAQRSRESEAELSRRLADLHAWLGERLDTDNGIQKSLSTRIQDAYDLLEQRLIRLELLAARNPEAPLNAELPVVAYPTQLYPGFLQGDETLLARHQVKAQPTPGLITDFLGIRTDPAVIPYAKALAGKVLDELPFPHDGFHAEAIEYASVAEAVEAAGTDRFCAVEIGAGWGPWVCAAGVLARRKGAGRIDLIAVEADPGRYEFLKAHLAENGLRPRSDEAQTAHEGVHCTLIQGAGWYEDTTMYFPAIDSAQDHGAAATSQQGDTDYRGFKVEQRAVKGVGMRTLLADVPRVDFMHVDIQGGESELIPRCVDVLTEKVAHLFIGTHSRKIEGDLIATLIAAGWKLRREKPCRFELSADRPSLEAMTQMDGSQFWVNPRLAGQPR